MICLRSFLAILEHILALYRQPVAMHRRYDHDDQMLLSMTIWYVPPSLCTAVSIGSDLGLASAFGAEKHMESLSHGPWIFPSTPYKMLARPRIAPARCSRASKLMVWALHQTQHKHRLTSTNSLRRAKHMATQQIPTCLEPVCSLHAYCRCKEGLSSSTSNISDLTCPLGAT